MGGTCANSTWRNQLIPQLEIDFFNPVVDDWDEDAYDRELHERETCDFCMYTITPKMEGVYSIAEVIDDSNKRHKKTVFVVLSSDGADKFNEKMEKSLKAVYKMVKTNGGTCFRDLKSAAIWMNTQ